jgi:50S ribosomal protein L16 3-hydroxylase
MRRHWQRKPLLVRQAVPGIAPLLSRAEVFALAAREDVSSRLVVHEPRPGAARWRLRHGPFTRRSLPPVSRPGWTVLIQALDNHLPAAHILLRQFAFLPAARLDDAMLSWASSGGGVGPHFDSYDVFLLQVTGHRRWRIGPLPRSKKAVEAALVPGLPLKILAHFEPHEEHVLAPGDMLYLPPHWAHEGVALDECTTCSIGFRAPRAGELLREVLLRLADDAGDADAAASQALYSDAGAAPPLEPAAVPPGLLRFAQQALARALKTPRVVERALGEVLSEPAPLSLFHPGTELTLTNGPAGASGVGVVLDPATRMLHDEHHVFINGESYLARGRDAKLMRSLAHTRCLGAVQVRQLSLGARALLEQWSDHGWLHPGP